MDTIDHYATLGVPRHADTATITKAFRKLARKSHPDLNKGTDAEVRFKAVAEAYAVLKNPEKRAAYDNPPPAEHAGPRARPRATPPDSDELADWLTAFTRNARGDTPGARPFGGTGWQALPQAGRHLELTTHLSLLDAHKGTTIRVNVPSHKAGQGSRSLDVTIPPGTAHGQTMRLREQGEPGHLGGPAGDVYLHIALEHDPVFSVHGHDLHMPVALMPWQAVLGAEVEVPTLDGPVLLTVPAATRAGRKFRLRGRGLDNRQGGRGDLYALVHIDVPAVSSPAEQTLYHALSEAHAQRGSTYAEQPRSTSAGTPARGFTPAT